MSIANKFRCLLTRISPMLNTKVCYFVKFHKRLDLKNPKTLNEKNLWLKMYRYRNNPLVKQCADKYLVRDYIEKCGCGEILNPLYGVYDSPDEIDWDSLPDSFALKWNYGCGLNIIVSDKSKLNIPETVEKLKEMKKKEFYLPYSEFQYKNVTKKLLVEKYLTDGSGFLPTDYKVYCLNGKATYTMTCCGRENGEPKYYYFDRNWNICRELSQDGLDAPKDISFAKPDGFDDMLVYAEKLSKPFEFVRADFYLINGKTVFGELTFTPGGAMDQEKLPYTDKLMGDMLVLEK